MRKVWVVEQKWLNDVWIIQTFAVSKDYCARYIEEQKQLYPERIARVVAYVPEEKA